MCSTYICQVMIFYQLFNNTGRKICQLHYRTLYSLQICDTSSYSILTIISLRLSDTTPNFPHSFKDVVSYKPLGRSFVLREKIYAKFIQTLKVA